MKFSVGYENLTMDCQVYRKSPHNKLVLTGTVNGVCRMESNVEALRHLKPETFAVRVRESAICRLRDIAAGK